MNLDDLKNLGKDLSKNKTFDNMITSFMKELSNVLQKSTNAENIIHSNEISNNFEEGEVDFIYGLRDENVILLNPNTGEQKSIYIATSNKEKETLNSKGIYDNIYEMDKDIFHRLDFGDKLIMRNGNFEIYNDEVEIKDDKTWFLLDDMNGQRKKYDNTNFIVKEEQGEKFLLTHENGKGHIYIYKDIYPDFKVNDIVTRVDGKYYKK